jgi:transcriptional regulator with XRE-family HTH domain
VNTNDRPIDDGAIAAILASIGTQVRAARQAHGWHLSDIASLLGLSPSVLCRLELARREPSFHQILSTCTALGLRLSDVLRRAENEAFPLGCGPWDSPIWRSWDTDGQ